MDLTEEDLKEITKPKKPKPPLLKLYERLIKGAKGESAKDLESFLDIFDKGEVQEGESEEQKGQNIKFLEEQVKILGEKISPFGAWVVINHLKIHIDTSKYFDDKKIRESLGDDTSNYQIKIALSSGKTVARASIVLPNGSESIPVFLKHEFKTEEIPYQALEGQKTKVSTTEIFPGYMAKILETMLEEKMVASSFLKAAFSEVHTRELGAHIRALNNKIGSWWGIYIGTELNEYNEEFLVLKKRDEETPDVYLRGEIIDLALEEAQMPKRQRRQKPSHGKLKL